MKSLKFFLVILISCSFFSCAPTVSGGGKADETYTVVYHANGGIGEDYSVPGLKGKCVLTQNRFISSAEWLRFDGWSTRADGTVDYLDEAEVSVSENMDLYAVWIDDKLEKLKSLRPNDQLVERNSKGYLVCSLGIEVPHVEGYYAMKGAGYAHVHKNNYGNLCIFGVKFSGSNSALGCYKSDGSQDSVIYPSSKTAFCSGREDHYYSPYRLYFSVNLLEL